MDVSLTQNFTVEQFQAASDAKFAVFERPSGDLFAVIFPRAETHADQVQAILIDRSEAHFLGAGFLKREGEEWAADWKSETCAERFGYDRPADKNLAAKLLKEFKRELLAL